PRYSILVPFPPPLANSRSSLSTSSSTSQRFSYPPYRQFNSFVYVQFLFPPPPPFNFFCCKKGGGGGGGGDLSYGTGTVPGGGRLYYVCWNTRCSRGHALELGKYAEALATMHDC